MAEEQLVVFQLGTEEYALPIAQVKEIIHYRGATKMPSAPAYVEGVINLRGQVISVVDLAARFAIAAQGNAERRVIIVEADGQDLGIIVDAVTEVIRLSDSDIDPAPAISGSIDYIRGIGKCDNRLLLLLDLDKLFIAGNALSA